MVQNGLFTRNEVRALENMPPIEGADKLTAQVNMAPLDKLGEAQPVPAPEPKSDINISMPEQKFTVNAPSVEVKTPDVLIKSDPPVVNVHIDPSSGSVERTVTAYDEKGFPKTVIERKV
jgi:hypothetical protein